MSERVKVRILSGNEKGVVVEMDRAVAETEVATGFAELFIDLDCEADLFITTPLEEALTDAENAQAGAAAAAEDLKDALAETVPPEKKKAKARKETAPPTE